MKFGKKRVSECLQNPVSKNHAKCVGGGSSAACRKIVVLYIMSFNAFYVTGLILYLLKIQNIFLNFAFLLFSEGTERDQWHEMC